MTRHASADELASLDEGVLRPRRAAKIEAHVVTCVRCTRLRHQLDEVPAVLASAPYPLLSQTYAVRLEAAIKTEANHRLAAAPAAESGRRDLPARRRQLSWHFPGLSVPATRLVAAAGALVLIVAGGYALGTNLTSAPTPSSSSSSVSGSARVQQMSLGPAVQYGQPGSAHIIHVVQSSADFAPRQLRTEAIAAVHAAQARGASTTQGPTSPGASASQGSASAPFAAAPGNGSAAHVSPLVSRLEGCLDRVVPGRTVLLLDLAKYRNKAAAIIVVASVASSPAQVWVVGNTCSATNSDVFTHASVSHV